MKQLVCWLGLAALGACDLGDAYQDPRDRGRSGGTLSWRLVEQQGGAAVFLARPGAAPDLVLWCDGNGEVTLRAHVFANPKPNPDLILKTSGGQIRFEQVRRQGGMRASDRKLVEGQIGLDRSGVAATILAASDLTLMSGEVVYQSVSGHSANVLPVFMKACSK
ncbi:hypothetical protein [Candidatus Phycosocius spiralis]|uniref:Uncharacterized protein n=1 Tax=Candidatus Phycosocius spiralis TaxID=2815099 RepID=A0ABQ4PWD9_9PROT|nr:hypothetical protein [Candidatus Phycosocius spiralis]GIU67379.1 hypothetical protein PsB1_1533 [Candidatus Phycosocius spiralis]